jgi:hypothetical protein
VSNKSNLFWIFGASPTLNIIAIIVFSNKAEIEKFTLIKNTLLQHGYLVVEDIFCKDGMFYKLKNFNIKDDLVTVELNKIEPKRF